MIHAERAGQPIRRGTVVVVTVVVVVVVVVVIGVCAVGVGARRLIAHEIMIFR